MIETQNRRRSAITGLANLATKASCSHRLLGWGKPSCLDFELRFEHGVLGKLKIKDKWFPPWIGEWGRKNSFTLLVSRPHNSLNSRSLQLSLTAPSFSPQSHSFFTFLFQGQGNLEKGMASETLPKNSLLSGLLFPLLCLPPPSPLPPYFLSGLLLSMSNTLPLYSVHCLNICTLQQFLFLQTHCAYYFLNCPLLSFIMCCNFLSLCSSPSSLLWPPNQCLQLSNFA